MVVEFHQVFGCTTGVTLASAPEGLIDLRIDLIEEELGEVMVATRAGDVLDVARELADLAYVTAGTAVAFGLTLRAYGDTGARSMVADCGAVNIAIVLRTSTLTEDLSRLMATIYQYARLFEVDLDAAVAEVHRANLSKLGDDGLPVERHDGKILKGPNFREPDMRCAVRWDVLQLALRHDFTVPIGGTFHAPPWWLDGIGAGR